MVTKEKKEFEECLKEVRTKNEIRKLMEECCEEMTEDEMLWGRWYNKEEEEARILEGIKAEIARKAYQEEHEKGFQEGRQEGHEEGREEGHEEGREEGHQEGIKQVAKEMLKNDMDISIISKYTGLTMKQIHNLK